MKKVLAMPTVAAAMDYQLKITLRGIKPPVWRRIRVPGAIKLSRLHHVIQTAFGWTDTHLHSFNVNGETFGDSGQLEDLDHRSEGKFRLEQIATVEGARVLYIYDFGDDWLHDIVVEEIASGDLQKAQCLAGKRNVPPEDCGGPWGYADLIEALRTPAHPRHAELREWVGSSFDPEEFDLVLTNKLLSKLRIR